MSLIKTTPLNYLQHVDFSDYADTFLMVSKGNQDITTLTTCLGKLTGHPWSSKSGEYSLLGAKVVYFGVNKKTFPTLGKRSHVLIIKLSDKSETFTGKQLYLTFND